MENVTDTIATIIDTPPANAGRAKLFDNLNALRLSYGQGVLAGAKEHISRVPVEKPPRQDFWRAHPSDEMTLITSAFEDKETREYYIIAPEMVSSMLALNELVAVKLTPTINRQGVVRLLPAKLPSEASVSTSWHDTLLLAIERARKHWVRISADMSLGGYRIFEAQGALVEPKWPDLDLSAMLEIGFKGRVIDSEDHPIFNKLLGRI